jgi:hypothetical protein
MPVGDDGRPRQDAGMRADHAVPPAELGVVERSVGARENLVDRLARPPFANPDAPGQRDPVLAGIEGARG